MALEKMESAVKKLFLAGTDQSNLHTLLIVRIFKVGQHNGTVAPDFCRCRASHPPYPLTDPE